MHHVSTKDLLSYLDNTSFVFLPFFFGNYILKCEKEFRAKLVGVIYMLPAKKCRASSYRCLAEMDFTSYLCFQVTIWYITYKNALFL